MSEAAYENLRQMLGEEYLDTIDKPLTEEEKAAVLSREDHGVTSPVQLQQFETVDEFKKVYNNFFIHFAPEGPQSSANPYRTRRAFQRFEILYPDLTKKLLGKYDRGKEPNEEEQRDLFEAYKLMSPLVDATDVDVVIDGKVNQNYLGTQAI